MLVKFTSSVLVMKKKSEKIGDVTSIAGFKMV
jgi:hypothetical protein